MYTQCAKIVIRDLHQIARVLTEDQSLYLVGEVMTITEALESLIEEKMGPSEYPEIMDSISDYLDIRPDILDTVSYIDLEVMSMKLQAIQQNLDAVILRGVNPDINICGYEVVRWLGETTAIISISTEQRLRR